MQSRRAKHRCKLARLRPGSPSCSQRAAGARRRTRPSSSSSRTGCRRRIRCRRRCEEWGASVEKASNGTIKFKIYPVAAARQGVRPLRHGARRHRRLDLRQSGLSARPLPDHRRRRIAVPDRRRQGRHPRRSTPGIANTPATEMKDVKYCFSFILDPLTCHSQHQEDRGAGRHQGHEDPAVARHGRRLGDAARRHQRAGAAPPKCAT